MSNSIALFSLIVLVACIAIGFALKKNVGLIAVLAAAVFGSAAGYTDSQIIKGFSSSTFIMLLGVSLLCTIATNNGTLELAAKKFLRLSGGHVAITPVIMYLIGYIVAAIGPGCVPALGIAAALSLPLGKSTGYNSVMLAAIGQIGSMAGRFSPITPESVLIYNLASEQGITGYQTHTLIYATITTIVLSIVIFLVFKGFRIKEPQSKEKESLPAFTQKQIITLVGFLAMIVASAFFKRNVGLISFAVAVVLLLLNVADEKVVIKGVPWSTLLMVTGIGMLMNIVSDVGGVALMSNGLASIMTPKTAVAIQGLSAGILSWFSSAIGVVWPTMVPAPTVGTMVVQLCDRRRVAHHGAYSRCHRRAGRRQAGGPYHHHVPDRFLCRLQPGVHRRQPDHGGQRHRPRVHERKREQALHPDVRSVRPAAAPDGLGWSAGPVQYPVIFHTSEK